MTYNNYKGLMTNLKEQLYHKFVSIAQQRITDLELIIKEAQYAANNETKSSAGDKHETGRSMAQLETEKLTKQLGEALKLSELLHKINPQGKHQLIGLGSLVITTNGNFFISASLGKIELNEITYFAISSISPIGQLLIQKKENDSFSFNTKSYVINKVD